MVAIKEVQDEREMRCQAGELRVAKRQEGKLPKIAGYAAVFNQLSENLGGFYERVAPGAFTRSLQEADVRDLINHDPNMILGRMKAGTLALKEDDHGLAFELDPADTQYARDLVTSIERGDVDQMSFAFRTVKDKWEQVGNQVIRTLMDVDLYDVSQVTFPAYPQTSAAVRSMVATLTEGSGDSPEGEDSTAEAEGRRVRFEMLKRKLETF